VHRVIAVVVAAGCGRLHFDELASDASDARSAVSVLYANTFDSLYAIDPQTLQPTHLADFTTPGAVAVQLGDIAVDSAGNLIGVGVSTPDVYSVDPATGVCTAISTNLPVAQYGIGFATVSGQDVLMGAGGDANLYRIDATTGAASLVGAFGLAPSGDLAWAGGELLLTTRTAGTDGLARVDLVTGQATAIGDTTYTQVLALAWFGGILYGLTGGGQIVVLDPATGSPIQTKSIGGSWVGAASPPS
jgi:hypothetical protein